MNLCDKINNLCNKEVEEVKNLDVWDVKDIRDIGKQYKAEFLAVLKLESAGKYQGYFYKSVANEVFLLGAKKYVILTRKNRRIDRIGVGMIWK